MYAKPVQARRAGRVTIPTKESAEHCTWIGERSACTVGRLLGLAEPAITSLASAMRRRLSRT